MTDWQEFLEWAHQFAGAIDIDRHERQYKLAMANRVSQALEAARNDDAGWLAGLRKALQGSNLLPWQFTDSLLKAAESRREDLRTAILDLVGSADPLGELDDFADRVRHIHTGATPGNLVAFASVLLMSRDSSTYPPYRPEPVGEWSARVGVEATTDTPRARYESLLSLCDALLGDAATAEVAIQDRLDAQGLAWTVLKADPPVTWTPLEQSTLAAWREGKPTDNVVVHRGTGWSPAMEAAVWAILGPGLRGENSALAPQLRTWDPSVAEDLRSRIEDNPDAGKRSFLEKLESQLAGASDEVIVLAAELLYIHSAPLSNVSGHRKRERFEAVLGWAEGTYPVPPEIDAGFDVKGSFNGGVGFNVQMWTQLIWLCRFVITWCETPPPRRDEALRDPLAFSDLAGEVPKTVTSIRYSLEYLAWPGWFPWVASDDHRRWILKGLAEDIGGPSGTDARSRTRDLVSLRQLHQRQNRNQPVSWYQAPFYERWWPGVTPAPRAWLVRPSEGGADLVDNWLADGYVSLSAKMLGTVEPGASLTDVSVAVDSGYLHLDASQREATTTAYHLFLSVMKDDDLVATLVGGQLHLGVIGSAAYFTEVGGSRLRRDVTWTAEAVSADDVDAPIPGLLDQQGTVIDLTGGYDVLAALVDQQPGPDDDEEGEPERDPRPASTPSLPKVSDEVAASLHIDREALQQIVDLLQRRNQIVLYGPPGTGKTYLAKELARHLVGDPSRVRLVQFHPSYSYEDFFEGYRPVETANGQPSFQLKSGPLKLLAEEARLEENRANAFILIVDEMNRANLAKVFGELYFLLEYRRESVRLQYRPETPFQLPPNIFIIGTMNTADRSIALVDAAIRRRFPFFELHPSEAPVNSVLERYLAANHLTDGRAGLLAELNDRIGEAGHDLQIGPSYLMRSDIRSASDIDLVWRYDIMPLLEEHYYGQLHRNTIRERFGIDSIRKAVAGRNLSGEPSGATGIPVAPEMLGDAAGHEDE